MQQKGLSFLLRLLSVFAVIALLVMLEPFSTALSFDQRTAKLIEGAKKEGKFVYVSSSIGTEEAAVLNEAFKKYYGLEGLEIEFFRLLTQDLVRRTEEEKRRISCHLIYQYCCSGVGF